MGKHKLINWQEAMELSAEHFIQTDNFFLEAIADTASLGLSDHNFGLLPSRTKGKVYNTIRVSEHISDRVEVQMLSCNAVTASGIRIQFNTEGEGEALVESYSPSDERNNFNRNAKQLDIILKVNPFERTATGELDPREAPPRHPCSESSYTLYVMPSDDINTIELGNHYLTIGRMLKEGERYMVDSYYIPPCMSMSAHPDLLDYYSRFGGLFDGLEKSSARVLENIYAKADKNPLVANIKILSESILRYCASIFFDYRNKERYIAPMEVVGYVSTLAHQCLVSLIMMEGRQKEEMLQYFGEWTDVTSGVFEDMLSETMEIRYDHGKLRAMMVQVERFLQTLAELYGKLSNLAFIGQRREKLVVTQRSNQPSGRENVGKWVQ